MFRGAEPRVVGLFLWRALAALVLVAAVVGSFILVSTQIQVAASSVHVQDSVASGSAADQRSMYSPALGILGL
ncbi:hypothetical protein ACIQH5_20735 [Paenarthrobacter sp. NPDC091711]|uniref:hypothetical protein n=1 Tax=Paenarthrobacter sp. NPDC091711 TaxID=3364385 RepID=UPI00381D3EBB